MSIGYELDDIFFRWLISDATPTRVEPLVLDLNRDGKVELKNAAFLT